MALKLVTAPAEEPVSLVEMKLHLRVDHSNEDESIAAFITAARQYCENFTRRAFITQTWELYLDEWPSGDKLTVPLPPLQSITSIKYYDTADGETTLGTSVYMVDGASEPGRVVLKYGQSWPSTALRGANGVIVRFVAGYGLAAGAPMAIRQAIKMLAGHYFENRESVLAGQGFTAMLVPQGLESSLWPYRNLTF